MPALVDGHRRCDAQRRRDDVVSRHRHLERRRQRRAVVNVSLRRLGQRGHLGSLCYGLERQGSGKGRSPHGQADPEPHGIPSTACQMIIESIFF